MKWLISIVDIDLKKKIKKACKNAILQKSGIIVDGAEEGEEGEGEEAAAAAAAFGLNVTWTLKNTLADAIISGLITFSPYFTFSFWKPLFVSMLTTVQVMNWDSSDRGWLSEAGWILPKVA